MPDLAGYLSHGTSIDEFIRTCGSQEKAARELWEYICGEAADETALYDPDAATAMRKTSLADVAQWLAGQTR
jgi:hypothetical protein